MWEEEVPGTDEGMWEEEVPGTVSRVSEEEVLGLGTSEVNVCGNEQVLDFGTIHG